MEMDMYFDLHKEFKKKTGSLFVNVKLRRFYEAMIVGGGGGGGVKNSDNVSAALVIQHVKRMRLVI
jgi:hypothetical protein